MAQDRKYGQVEVPGIPEDEPVFILRAQDVLALPTLHRYKNFRIVMADDHPFEREWMENLDAVIEEFAAFANDKSDVVKIPD